MDRRQWLAGLGVAGFYGAFGRHGRSPVDPPQTSPEPDAAQQKFMALKKGMFIHFGINTYYDTEWSDGSLDPSKVNPYAFDPAQWCATARKAGLKYIVFVTKHCDGFCNWPTAHTRYSIAATPFKKDLLGMVVKAARKEGLEVGLYYSLWDRHEKVHDTDEWAYVNFMKGQLNELLSNYGPVVQIWFDGFWKKQQSGWKKKGEIEGENVEDGNRQRDEEFIQAWRMEGAYRWQMDHLYQYIKSLQPECLVMNNSTTAYPGVPLHPVDIRSGEKATHLVTDRKIWNFLGRDRYLPLQIETTLSTKGEARFPSGNWFWHEWDHSVATREQVMAWFSAADRMNANILLNVGPMASGKLRPEDESLLLSLEQK